jgi:hypothetical protein
MKFTAIFAAAVAVLAGSVVAQPETPEQCRARCNQFYVDCIANGGTETFCRGLTGMSTYLGSVQNLLPIFPFPRETLD